MCPSSRGQYGYSTPKGPMDCLFTFSKHTLNPSLGSYQMSCVKLFTWNYLILSVNNIFLVSAESGSISLKMYQAVRCDFLSICETVYMYIMFIAQIGLEKKKLEIILF